MRTCAIAVTLAFSLLHVGIAHAEPDASADRRVVRFKSSLGKDALTLECAPKTKRAAMTPAWVDACNRLASAAIDKAVQAGTIASPAGEPFGMAGTTAKSLPADAPLEVMNLARDLKRIDGSL